MKPRIGARARYSVLRIADTLSRRGRGPSTPLHLQQGERRRSFWLFVSTIGELNAIAPLLTALESATGDLQWVILSDRRVYAEAYRLRHPTAEVVEIGDHPGEAERLARLRPPALFLIAEIPLQPSDAPCRLPYAWLFEAASRGARIVSVNGWLYGYPSACRIDAIERSLASRDWLALHDHICVQTDSVAQTLLALGHSPDRISVTGNIKFDALDRQAWSVAASRSPRLLASLLQHDRPTVVAGCVTDADEQTLVLDAFTALRQALPDALLVIAPRHPEQAEVMAKLDQALNERSLTNRLRSTHGDQLLDASIAVLVLDTMGELRDFYACADVAHVGRDHNVLEPLAFGTAVSVRPNWEPTYPSYPVFIRLSEEKVLMVHEQAHELAACWCTSLGEASSMERAQRVEALVARVGGATQRTLTVLAPLLADRAALASSATSDSR